MVEPGRHAAELLLARMRPDAILCANDLLAVGVLAALRDARLDVPGHVALVGMDNTDLSALTWPALTTVDLGSSERARIAAELLLARIEDPGPRGADRRGRAAPRRAGLLGAARMSTVNEVGRYQGRRPRSRAGAGLSGREAMLLLIPAFLADRDPQRDPARCAASTSASRTRRPAWTSTRASSGSTTSGR